jgi:NADH-quinone oxidoreductase subunit M
MIHAEYDLILMTLVIFVPTVFALALLFFPRGSEEYMRWWSLLGTAITLVLSLWIFIDYLGMLDYHLGDQTQSSLQARLENMQGRAGVPDARNGLDWLTRFPWISRFNIDYYLGIDGISMPLILLTTIISFLAMLASWNIERYVRGYCALFLLLETGMVGTFLALDFFLFYIFWEVMLLPMYFLIGVWGGPRREYAAIKFFLYTLLGSVFILIALLAFYFTDVQDFVHAGVLEERIVAAKQPGMSFEDARKKIGRVNSFDLVVLQRVGKAAALVLSERKSEAVAQLLAQRKYEVQELQKRVTDQKQRQQLESLIPTSQQLEKRLEQSFFTPWFQYTMFLLLFVGFAIKVPLFPFHTWLPDAHVEAPTPISMILAGVLLKMGGYGIIRIAYPICPWAAEQLALWIGIFAMINIVYGAFAAMAQTDFKKLVAYSSVSHMGYVILGIAVWSLPQGSQYWAWGMNGAMFQMIAHGVSSAGMFFLVGVIYDRAHHRNLDNFRGLYEPMPLYGGISAIIFFAALGLPGLCGFVGEFMVVLATWNFSPAQFPSAGPLFAVLAAGTVVITAAYILWTLQRVFFGTNSAYKGLPDINLRELLCVVPLLVLAVLLGVAPQLLLNWVEPHVTGLVDNLAQVTRRG